MFWPIGQHDRHANQEVRKFAHSVRKSAAQVGVPVWPMKYFTALDGVIFDDGHEIDPFQPHAKLNCVSFFVPGRSHLHPNEILVINSITTETARGCTDAVPLAPDQNCLVQFSVGGSTILDPNSIC